MKRATSRRLPGPFAFIAALALLAGCGSDVENDDKSGGNDAVMKMLSGEGAGQRESRIREIRPEKPNEQSAVQPAQSTGGVTASGTSSGGTLSGGTGSGPSGFLSGPGSASTSSRATLKRAVVLPQTLPGGTQATFSVEYELSGGPRSGHGYAWMIAAADGREKTVPVELETSGSLQLLNSGFAPTDGPFRCWLVETPEGGAASPLCDPVNFRS